MSEVLRARLFGMMLMQYGVMGAWAVTLPSYWMALPHAGGLGLSAARAGLLYGTLAVAATVTPLVVGLVADRLFPTQRVLAALHAAGAALLVLLAVRSEQYQHVTYDAFLAEARETWANDHVNLDHLLDERHALRVALGLERPPRPSLLDRVANLLPINQYSSDPNVRVTEYRFPTGGAGVQRLEHVERQMAELLPGAVAASNVRAAADRAFPELFGIMLAYALCYMPTLTLTSSLAFRNLPEPRRQFGSVRVGGTVGWALAGLAIGRLFPAVSLAPAVLAAVASGVMAAYCLTLPHTPPAGTPKTLGEALGLPALRLFREPGFGVFAAATLANTTLYAFHNVYTNRYLVSLGVPHAAAWQTLGQATEVAAMLLLPVALTRLGTRRTLLLGLTVTGLRYVAYAGGTRWTLYVGVPLHGVGYTLFYIGAALFVDARAPRDLRASTQGLVTVLSSGLGAFVGNWAAGRIVDRFTVDTVTDWRTVWLVPAVGSLLVAGLFAALFRDPAPLPEPADDARLPRSPQL